MKWNIKSKRWITILLNLLIWCGVGFVAGKWEVFKYMTIPVLSLIGTWIAGESWKPSGGGEE